MLSPRHAVALAAAAAVVVTAGCGGDESVASNNGAPATIGLGSNIDGTVGGIDGVAESADDVETIVMIGDSITYGAVPEIESRFTELGFDDVTIDAMPGKRISRDIVDNPAGSSVAAFIASGDDGQHDDELWIVALGTNDVGQYASAEEIAGAVDEVLDAVPDDVPLVWVDVFFRDRPDEAAQVNAIIRERLARRGNAVVAPWTEFAGADGVLVGDGVHTTDSGADTFAFVVTDSTRAFLDR
ncbi:MAG: GDSL-type esterase/lipase family protein [Actinomycetota bacterium]